MTLQMFTPAPGPSRTESQTPLFDPAPDSSDEVSQSTFHYYGYYYILQDDETPKTIQPTVRKRPRSAGVSTTGIERRNVRRVSAGEGMTTMAGSMSTVASTLADAMQAAASTMRPPNHAVALQAAFTQAGPVANTNGGIPMAIAMIEANEGFSDDDLVDAAGCLTADPNLATTYTSIASQSARSRFIRKQMDKFRT
jgi:hypothetical protein